MRVVKEAKERRNAILDAVIEKITDQLIAKAGSITRKKDVPVLKRLTLATGALNVESPLGSEIMEQVHKPQNALLHQKMQEIILPLFQNNS